MISLYQKQRLQAIQDSSMGNFQHCAKHKIFLIGYDIKITQNTPLVMRRSIAEARRFPGRFMRWHREVGLPF